MQISYALALCRILFATFPCIAGCCYSLYGGAKFIWSRSFFDDSPPLSPSNILCRYRSDTDACSSHYILGNLLSRKRRPDGSFWLCST
ncbi:MAG TPA: hypothetical protein EYG31_07110 [Porticoccaceae bacterium]|nr:hypothetical protein [Gammaproteobacteria bacterium]HIL60391.1 hypothetical protein [Porticoccaceae bacterium]